jgi:hypothetical protein
MKKARLLSSFFLLLLSSFTITKAQDSIEKLNLPGDNLNLYAVLKIFQESPTLEAFEKTLNDRDSKINNMDLNNDNQVDYIKVIDHVDGNVHNIVLQDITNRSESQDVAVIVVQKTNDNQVQIQIIGDEDLYGKNYIIEPNFETDDVETKTTPNPGYTGGGSQTIVVEKVTTREIYNWPIVRVIYTPDYIVWVSPWYWDYYPAFWNPWTPLYWHYYYGWHNHWNYYYYGHYRHWHDCRYNRWNNFYFSQIRVRSPYYIKMRESGVYKTTYSRPDLMKQSSLDFKTRYPNAPSANERLPKINNIKPIQPRSVRPKQNNIGQNQETITIPHPQSQPKIKNNERTDIPKEKPIRNRPNVDEIQAQPVRPIQNNERNDIPRDQPIRNRPYDNRNIDKKRALPERQENKREGNSRKGSGKE